MGKHCGQCSSQWRNTEALHIPNVIINDVLFLFLWVLFECMSIWTDSNCILTVPCQLTNFLMRRTSPSIHISFEFVKMCNTCVPHKHTRVRARVPPFTKLPSIFHVSFFALSLSTFPFNFQLFNGMKLLVPHNVQQCNRTFHAFYA